jgi:hypothetical protein
MLFNLVGTSKGGVLLSRVLIYAAFAQARILPCHGNLFGDWHWPRVHAFLARMERARRGRRGFH